MLTNKTHHNKPTTSYHPHHIERNHSNAPDAPHRETDILPPTPDNPQNIPPTITHFIDALNTNDHNI